MIQMTRQQYQQKYGTAPGVSQAGSVSQPSAQPIKMTRAQYEQKYGQSVAPEKKTVGGFLKNIPSSFGRLVTDTGSAILNIANTDMEQNTIANLGKLAVGTVQYLDPTQKLGTQYEDNARAVGNFYKDRYGGLDKIGNTLYNDPVGAIADVAAVATGVGGAVKGGVAAAGKLGAVTKAGKLAKVARVADTVAKVGNTIDPLQATARVSKPLFSRINPAVSRATSNVSDYFGAKAQKFNRTDIEAIKDATGTDPLTFARREGLPIAATTKNVAKAQEIIDAVKDQYNALTKTGKPVSRADYAAAIKAQADELLARSDTPSTRSLAEKLYEEAEYQLNNTAPMDDTLLAGTKSEAFGNASKNQINDPLVSGREEKLGRAAVETLERPEYAPGSKALGKKQRGLIEYTNRLESQANTGKGTQFVNLFKPIGTGVIAGFTAGTVLPGLGNVGGAIGGAAIAAIVNSPQFLSKASNLLYGASKSSITPAQKSVLSKIVAIGKAGRVLTPTSPEVQEISKMLQDQQSQVETPSSNYTLQDQMAQNMGLDVEEMRQKRKQNQLFTRDK